MFVNIFSIIIELEEFPQRSRSFGATKTNVFVWWENLFKRGGGLILMDFFRQKTNLSYDRKGCFCFVTETGQHLLITLTMYLQFVYLKMVALVPS